MAVRKIAETAIDRFKFACASTGLILKRPKAILLFLFSLLFFLYFLSFFRDGSSNWRLIWSGLAFDRKLEVAGRIFPAILENFCSFYGITIILLSLLQSIIIVHLVFAWRHRERASALDGASTSGIGAVLGFIALGCPSCGIGLLTPLLSAIAGSAAVALAEGLGYVFTVLAFALLIYSFVKLGYANYVTILAAKQK